MGPTDTSRALFEVRAFQRSHPTVIITPPDESLGGNWEVSFPSSATMAFDSAETMLTCLKFVSVPEDDDIG